MGRFQCTCGMVISTPARRARCLRCRKLLGWQERLSDSPRLAPAVAAEVAAVVAASVSTAATPLSTRPTRVNRISTTISVLLNRPRQRIAIATD